MASCILPMLNPMNHGVLWSTGQIWCPMGGLTDPGADIPESWDWRLRVAQWCGRRQHVTIEIRWGEEIGFKNLIVNQWLASPWRNSWRRWWREREREHHKKWIQIIQHVWKIFISFVFNHWGFWSRGGSQVILDFSLRNGKTWIIWDDDPQWDDWIIVAWLGARCLKYGRCHPKMVISCDSYVWIRWREAVVGMMFLSQQLHHIQSIMWYGVHIRIYILYVYTHTHIYIYIHCN